MGDINFKTEIGSWDLGIGLASEPTMTVDGVGFVQAFLAALSVIVVSEVGDKTFFIAAIMAMRHSRLIVFAGAMFALVLMTVLSASLGYAITIIPRVYTWYASTILFVIFGLTMLYDGITMSGAKGAEELEEVQASLKRQDDPEAQLLKKETTCLTRMVRWLFSPVFLQALTMTFMGEWGDRSQLATVILAAKENILGVISGSLVGHILCTGLAVIGGRMVAKKISVRMVTIIGGLVFLSFAILSLMMKPE